MNAETVLASIDSLNSTISELESLRTLHLMEAQKMIPFIMHDLHERMHKLTTASEHPSDFPSIVSVYTGHLADFYWQLETVKKLILALNMTHLNNEIKTFEDFYLISRQKIDQSL